MDGVGNPTGRNSQGAGRRDRWGREPNTGRQKATRLQQADRWKSQPERPRQKEAETQQVPNTWHVSSHGKQALLTERQSWEPESSGERASQPEPGRPPLIPSHQGTGESLAPTARPANEGAQRSWGVGGRRQQSQPQWWSLPWGVLPVRAQGRGGSRRAGPREQQRGPTPEQAWRRCGSTGSKPDIPEAMLPDWGTGN